MSHTTRSRSIDGVWLSAIHNSDHSGPTTLLVVKGDKVLAEIEVPDGEMLMSLASKLCSEALKSEADSATSVAHAAACASAAAVLDLYDKSS